MALTGLLAAGMGTRTDTLAALEAHDKRVRDEAYYWVKEEPDPFKNSEYFEWD